MVNPDLYSDPLDSADELEVGNTYMVKIRLLSASYFLWRYLGENMIELVATDDPNERIGRLSRVAAGVPFTKGACWKQPPLLREFELITY